MAPAQRDPRVVLLEERIGLLESRTAREVADLRREIEYLQRGDVPEPLRPLRDRRRGLAAPARRRPPLWALVGLALVVAGMHRRVHELRVGGFALLGIALVKLFGFDLSQLSSFARAASFLAVGGALLAGGFLVQRLTPPERASSSASGRRGRPEPPLRRERGR